MITYNPAFDLYHCMFRMAHILQKLDDGNPFEVNKVRIWDFYLLFPSKVYDITLHQEEADLIKARKEYIKKTDNPYEYSGDNRKLFEWIRPFQVSALNCLVSCGILGRDDYLNNKVCVINHKELDKFVEESGELTNREKNVLAFMGLLSRNMPLTGARGLKARTHLLEFRYDAK